MKTKKLMAMAIAGAMILSSLTFAVRAVAEEGGLDPNKVYYKDFNSEEYKEFPLELPNGGDVTDDAELWGEFQREQGLFGGIGEVDEDFFVRHPKLTIKQQIFDEDYQFVETVEKTYYLAPDESDPNKALILFGEDENRIFGEDIEGYKALSLIPYKKTIEGEAIDDVTIDVKRGGGMDAYVDDLYHEFDFSDYAINDMDWTLNYVFELYYFKNPAADNTEPPVDEEESELFGPTEDEEEPIVTPEPEEEPIIPVIDPTEDLTPEVIEPVVEPVIEPVVEPAGTVEMPVPFAAPEAPAAVIPAPAATTAPTPSVVTSTLPDTTPTPVAPSVEQDTTPEVIEVADITTPLGDIELDEIETPLVDIHLDSHLCNALFFIIMLMGCAVIYGYTRSSKKHNEKIFELRKELGEDDPYKKN